MTSRSTLTGTLAVCLFTIFCAIPQESLAAPEVQTFYPTWQLLTKEQKQQFVAGYIKGWRDAGKMTEIASQYVKNNPDKAVRALESIQGIYNVPSFSPSDLVSQIDEFYQSPENRSAGLSVAITRGTAS